MKIGVIVASPNKDKNQLVFEAVRKVAEPKGYSVINFGIFDDACL